MSYRDRREKNSDENIAVMIIEFSTNRPQQTTAVYRMAVAVDSTHLLLW